MGHSETAKYLAMQPVPDDQRPSPCENCYFGGKTVGARGPEDSPFVIVGESPGATELYRGYPFVGPSGDMLEDCLERVGLGKDDPQPYILNALQCLPRDKDTDKMQIASRCCQKRLHAELAKYPRKVILALGNSAAWSCTGEFGIKITNDRGRLFTTHLASIGTVITFHPAYLMRNQAAYAPWKRDVDYAVALLKGTNPKEGKWAPPMWSRVRTREEYEAVVERLLKAKVIGADTETGGKHGAGLNFQRGYILIMTLTSDLTDGRWVDIIPGNILWDNEDLTRKLMKGGAQWVWQNGKFDIKWYRFEGIPDARVDQDTMLLSYALNENKGHDLDTVAWDWIGAPKHKDAIDQWFKDHGVKKADKDYAMIPDEILDQYAAYDTSKTYRMFFPLHDAVMKDSHSRQLYYDLLIPGSEFLTQVEMEGLRLDLERAHYNDKYLLDQLEQDIVEVDEHDNPQYDAFGKLIYKYKSPTTAIQEYAIKHLGSKINIGSYQQLQRLLWNAMKLAPQGTSTDYDSLVLVQRKNDHPIIPHLMKWRTIAKGRNTYVKSAHQWPGVDYKVHVSFKLHATTTGRLASSDPTNLQNWPRDPQIRGQFVADDGELLVECDLNQAELRCLAIMSGDPTLLDIYTRNEVSIHHITSVAMFGESYTDDEKMRAKAVNFGIVYGRSAPSLAEEFNISLREANEYIRIWFERYPVAKQFIDASRESPAQQRTMITNFGRKKRWGSVSYEMLKNLENEAANFPHQSTAHDITLKSGIICQPVIRQHWNARFCNEIHDALYFKIKNDPAFYGPCIAYVQSIMQEVPKVYGLTRVPFLAEAKIGTRWGAKRNAYEMGERDPAKLAEYMTDFKPSDDDREIARWFKETTPIRRNQPPAHIVAMIEEATHRTNAPS